MREILAAGVVLALAVLVAYFPVTVGWESFYHHDRYFLHVPFWHGARESMSAGHFPFWTQGIRAGYPLLANGEASLLYPFTYLFLPFFAAHRALDFFTLFHLVLGGAFCWLYLRQLSGHRLVALIGAVAFALSGRLGGMTIWGHAVAAVAWLPLMLWAVDRRSTVALALGVGLGALTGRPQVHTVSLLIVAAYAALRFVQARREPDRLRHAARLGGGVVLGLGIGAAQLLPTVAFVSESSRSEGTPFAEWSSYRLGVPSLREMLVPGSYPTGWPEAASYPTLFVYAGIVLALVFLVRRCDREARRDTIFWLALSVVGIWVAFGGPGAWAVMQELPLLKSFRVPARFALIASFGALVIAVLAWRSVLAGRERWARVALLLVLADGVASVLAGRHTVVAGAYDGGRLFVDELQAAQPDETGSRRRFFATARWIQPAALIGESDRDVIAMFRDLAPTRNLAMRYGLRSVQGFGEPCFYWFPPTARETSPSLLRQLGAEFLVLRAAVDEPDLEPVPLPSKGWFAYRSKSVLPRARVVFDAERVPDLPAALRAAAANGFDAARRVIVCEPVPGVPQPATRGASVRVREDAPNRVVLDVSADAPGYLVLFDTWAPGWTATVNGRDAPIFRANGLFRLVRVPAGASAVVMRYWPPGLTAGIVSGLLSVLALLVLAFRGKRDARSATRSSS